MHVRRLLFASVLTSLTAVLFFGIGQYSAQQLLARQQAESDARIDALRAELRLSLATRLDGRSSTPVPAGTSGMASTPLDPAREALVNDIKRQLQS